VAIPRGYRLRPVEAVQRLAAAAISAGPVFRPVARGGRVGTAALSPYAASLVIKQRIAAVGLDPATYSGRGLRSGFLTSAAVAGEPSPAVRAELSLSRWRRIGWLARNRVALVEPGRCVCPLLC
jgi:hypothetical protein